MIEVTCAIIFRGNRVLIAQRSESMKLPLKWEFPGGKVEPGESKEDCLFREIKEELNIAINIVRALNVVEHSDLNSSLSLYPFVCTLNSGKIKAMEHAVVKWERLEKLSSYDWAEADLPVVMELLKIYQKYP